MSSQVNPGTINPSFPVPGVNQSSQGFRSNFLAIQNAFSQYVAEMNDVINKAIVSAPLTYGSSNSAINNFGGTLNSNLSLSDFGYASYTQGNIAGSSTQVIDFTQGYYQQLQITAGTPQTQTLQIANFPGLGYSSVLLDITATSVPQYVNIASLVPGATVSVVGGAGIAGYSKANANFAVTQTTANYQLQLSSVDGTNWFVSAPYGTAVARTPAPTTSYGAPGDTAGMIAYDGVGSVGGNIYVCTADYNGSAKIWLKAALGVF